MLTEIKEPYVLVTLTNILCLQILSDFFRFKGLSFGLTELCVFSISHPYLSVHTVPTRLYFYKKLDEWVSPSGFIIEC